MLIIFFAEEGDVDILEEIASGWLCSRCSIGLRPSKRSTREIKDPIILLLSCKVTPKTA